MGSTGSRIFNTTAVVAAGAAAFAYRSYRKEIKAAKQRVESGRQFIDSSRGPIEFGESGNGPAVFCIHGAGGGFDQGLDLGRAFLGDAYRVIAPSRFGYLGTPMPDDASVDAQVDAHVQLLDALHLESVPVIGVSAGAPSATQLCIQHPERCSVLILIVPGLWSPEKQTMSAARSKFFEVVLNTIASSDFIFWTASKVARSTLLETILGTPVQDFREGTIHDRRNIDAILRSILPISRRFTGIWNDGVTGSTLTRCELEKIHVPTLIISAADDLYGTYESSVYSASQIRSAKLVAFPTGGHMLLGHDAEVRSEVTRLLREFETKKLTAVAV
jgi:2-hydroxy-6-oxonona-2,4-dienedioate hydrolase